MVIKDLIKNKLGFIWQFIPLNILISISNQKILLPFYHTVSDIRLPHISNLYSIRSTELFLKDLEFFCKFYNPVSSDELYQIVAENKPVNKPVFHLSFDDGLKQIYSDVTPILEKKGIPASFFINTDFIDNRDLFYRYKISLIIEFVNKNKDIDLNKIAAIVNISIKNYQDFISSLLQYSFNDSNKINEIAKLLKIDFSDFLKNYQPYLKSTEISELIEKGFTIGSHSINHTFFKNLAIDEQKYQITESFRVLTNNLGVKNKYFSFPFSDENVTANLFKWLYNTEQCRLSYGISGLKDDLFKTHLHRITMEKNTDSADRILKTEYLYYLLKLPFGKNQIKREFILENK